jgi:hypothetical protein
MTVSGQREPSAVINGYREGTGSETTMECR